MKDYKLKKDVVQASKITAIEGVVITHGDNSTMVMNDYWVTHNLPVIGDYITPEGELFRGGAFEDMYEQVKVKKTKATSK